jgi:TP901 family phage tail tape measure protein
MSEYAAEVGVLFKPDMSLVDRAVMESASKWGRATNGLGKNFPLGKLTGDASEFHKSMDAANARVLAFGASMGSIMVVKKAFDLLVDSTINVEKQLAEVNSLFNLGPQGLQNFSSSLFKIANQMSVSFSDAAKAASIFAHHGLSMEETLKRTSAALELSKLSGMSMEESVLSLTSTINSFTKEALDAQDVVDRLTAVGGKYAASSDEIAEALKRVGASANDANVTFNQTIGLITAAQQITARGGSVIGNSFKSIFTRLQRPAVLDDLAAAGVQIRDLQGKILPIVSILKNLAVSYDTLSSSQKSFVSETVGGVYQVNVLKASLSDIKGGASIFEGAMDTAANSAGVAQKRIAILNETLASSMVRTQNEMTRLAANTGNISLTPGLKSGVGGLKSGVSWMADMMDSNKASSGSTGQQIGANLFQGIARGIGNVLAGPGIQFITTVFAKLMTRLAKFISDSSKDLLGVNSKEQEREAINANIAKWLGNQEGILEKIASGEMTIVEATQLRQKHLEIILRTYQDIATISGAITPGNNPTISMGGEGHASGFIPDVRGEVAAASQGGYAAGRVVGTTIRNGSSSFNSTVNTAETKSTINVGGTGRMADFINPPLNSQAGQQHRAKAIKVLGVDPYSLPQRSVNAEGFIPSKPFAMWEINSGNLLGKYKTRTGAMKAADRYKNYDGDSYTYGNVVGTFSSGRIEDYQAFIKYRNSIPSPFALGPLNSASGYVPNLSLDDMQARLKAIGINDWRSLKRPFATQYNKAANKDYPTVPDFDLSMLPESYLGAVTKHFTNHDDVAALLRFAQTQIFKKKLIIQTSSGQKRLPSSIGADALKSTFWNNAEIADTNDGLWGALRGSLYRNSQRQSC